MPRLVNFEIQKLYHLMERQIDDMSGHNCRITKQQGGVIHFLSQNKDRDIFQRDIEERFKIRRSTVSVMLSSMEENGYIKRESVDHDARLKKIVLTEKAAALDSHIRSAVQRYNDLLVSGIGDTELEVFFGVLDKIRTNIENAERNGEKV